MHATLKTARDIGLALTIALAPALPVRAQQASSAAVDAAAESQADDSAYFVSDEEASAFQPVSLANMQEPAENIAPRETPPRPATRRGPTGSRQGNIRLASVPNMFGDGFMTSARAVVLETPSGFNRVSGGGFDIPGAGGSRRVKIGENNKALPSDRVYFMYNHFENALSIQEQSLVPPGPNLIHQAPIDRYTFGVEKMFFDDLWSCEIRMPFNSSFSTQTENFGVGGGNVGNLAVILKNLLYVDESTSVAAGIGFDMPTGSSTTGQIGTMDLNFDNDSFHLLPYLGFVHALDEHFFVLGFAQIDVATNGNEVRLSEHQSAAQSLGYLTDQNLMYFDLSVGGWLYRNPYAERLTGIALMGEVHYTTTITNTDRLNISSQGTVAQIANPYNRQDIVNSTIALQFEIANTTALRVAAAFPLGDREDQRFFDSELQVQINRQF